MILPDLPITHMLTCSHLAAWRPQKLYKDLQGTVIGGSGGEGGGDEDG